MATVTDVVPEPERVTVAGLKVQATVAGEQEKVTGPLNPLFRALEHQFPLCVLMIDVDHFKSYNDRYGHLVGDRVLKSVAQVLKETIRTVDLAARYGGEEFSVLLLKTPMDGADKVAERIRQGIQELEIFAAKQATHVTVSIGVAELNPSLKNVEAFIDLADQALYQAKADGRNRVRLARSGPTHA